VTSSDDLAFASACDQARMVRDGEVSARELVDLYLVRIERYDPVLGSYVEVVGERARDAADAADQLTASGQPLGPLHGVPISVKDLNFLEGVRTTRGTRSLADHVAEYTDHNVDRLLAAGAIVLGKTNVPEFGSVGHTDTQMLGSCSTPWDLDRNAGGSSGGAGASLAAGLCGLAHGSDGAGSIRIPASVNGVVGLKPARDRVSHGPLYGETAFGLSTAGALTRSVADAALALDVMAGYELGDPGMAPPPSRSWSEELDQPVGVLRVGVSRQTPFSPDGLHPSSVAALDATVRLLGELGHQVEEVELPIPDVLADLLLTLWSAGIASQPFDPDTYEPINRWLYEVGHARSAAEYAVSQFRLQLMARRLVAGSSHLDVLLMPTLTAPSRRNGHFEGWEGAAIFADQTAFVGLTPLANLTGQPAISLPLHHDEAIGPVGVQFVGWPWDEAGLLRLSRQLEDAAPWHERRPPLPDR
jgi:amidase